MVLFRTGYFDGIPFVFRKGHTEFAADATKQDIVLLKSKVLPLSTKNITKIAVVDPNANGTKAMIGNYEGVPSKFVPTVDGFSTYAKVDHKTGCADVECKNESLIWPAVQAAKAADATISVVCFNTIIEAEKKDREDVELPCYQNQLVHQVANPSSGPIVLVVY